MVEDFQRRLPSVERGISEIKAEDIRISVLGTVIDKKEDGDSVRIALDDGSGKIDVGFESAVKVAVNQFVRVFGRVIPIENGFELQGEVVQDMGKLDAGLWKRVKDLNLRDFARDVPPFVSRQTKNKKSHKKSLEKYDKIYNQLHSLLINVVPLWGV